MTMDLSELRLQLEAVMTTTDPSVTARDRAKAREQYLEVFGEEVAAQAREQADAARVESMSASELAEETSGLVLGLLSAEAAEYRRDLAAELEGFRAEIRAQEEVRVERRARELAKDAAKVRALALEVAEEIARDRIAAAVSAARDGQRALPAPSLRDASSEGREGGNGSGSGVVPPDGIDASLGWGGGEAPRRLLGSGGRGDDYVSAERFDSLLRQREEGR